MQCLLSNLGQDIHLYTFHALWRVWEDHHRRRSHWVFPKILPWHHPTDRSVSDFLTPLPSPISASSSLCSAIVTSSNLPKCLQKTPLFSPTPHQLLPHPQFWSVKCEITDSQLHGFCGVSFNLRWTICCGWQRWEGPHWDVGTYYTYFHPGLSLFRELGLKRPRLTLHLDRGSVVLFSLAANKKHCVATVELNSIK